MEPHGTAREQGTGSRVRVYFCGCGPILADAMDLNELRSRVDKDPMVVETASHPILCSHDGQAWLEGQIGSCHDHPIVIAGCSCREHGTTFAGVLRRAGMNPFLLAMANLREQCVWVTEAPDDMLGKAEALTRAAVARASRLLPLEERDVECILDTLVIGGGVAGLTAARILAEAGRAVTLVEATAALGGRTALLDHIAPQQACASCLVQPLIESVLYNPAIHVLTLAEVETVSGSVGNFTATVRRRARFVDPDGCLGCRTCHDVCPAQAPSKVEFGLATRKAIDIPYPGARPNASVIDPSLCLATQGGDCDACVSACPFGNISLKATDSIVKVQVGAIVVATGATFRIPKLDRSPSRVVHAAAFERMLNPSGPTAGQLLVPGGGVPRSIALLHCIDENGQGPAESCSKVCCLTFAKYAARIAEKLPDCDVHQVLWGACAGGKGYREFFRKASVGARLTQTWLGPRDRVLGWSETDKGVQVHWSRDGVDGGFEAELVVVAPPLRGADTIDSIGSKMHLQLDAQGFIRSEQELLGPVRTTVDGIFVAGCAQGPADVRDATAQGAGAAGCVLSTAVPGRKLALEPAVSYVRDTMCGGCRTCSVTCPYDAVRFDAESRTASIDDTSCRGCGSCAAACPSGAIVARHFSDEQLQAEMTVLVRSTVQAASAEAPRKGD